MNLGIIARADKTGLGNQTRNLVRMLKPFRVMVIDSRPFNHNEQFFGTYAGRNTQIVKGFPTDIDVDRFLRGLNAVLTCELFYNPKLVDMANKRGIRTYNQYNYEFLDHLINPRLTLPTKLLSPSYWHLEEMQARYPARVVYLPPPTFESDFNPVYGHNKMLIGKPRFLHTVGRMAMNDRNGTLDLLGALKYTKSDFELVIKAQAGEPLTVNDSRVTLDYSAPRNETDLYRGFHALILPRRYAGLCLPMNEALMSGLPVIMTDVEPNNKVLPSVWLLHSQQVGTFKTRSEIPYYSANHQQIAHKLDWLCDIIANGTYVHEQEEARRIAMENYSVQALLPKYNEIIV